MKGKKVQDPVKVEEAWPALVCKKLFDEVQKAISDRAPKVRRPARVGSRFLLSGLLKCGVCGRTYTGQGAKSGQLAYYVCGALFREVANGSGSCVDVGKANLDVSVAEGPVVQFDNTAAGLTRLLKHLRALDVTMAVCESTGGYERLLVDRLRKTEITMYVAHPNRVRAFARACGYEAKTDPRDAQVLSRYGQVFPDAETPARELEPEREDLRDLLRRRRQLVEQRVRELGRIDKRVTPYVAKSTRRHISWLEKEIARLDKEYQAALRRSAPMAQRAALYCTVTGVGPLNAAVLVAHLPELGQWDGKSLTFPVGLAPWSRDSGRKRGRRAIRGGRGLVRRSLYICAWAVIRHDSEMRRLYRRLRERGKPGNVSVVAVMRKLLLQLNAIARGGRPWVTMTA